MPRLASTIANFASTSTRPFSTSVVTPLQSIASTRRPSYLPPKSATSTKRLPLPELGRRPVLEPQPETLSTLIDTLSILKKQARRPTAAAYTALIKAAAEYAVSRHEGEDARRDKIGWSTAFAALQDAKAGNSDLDSSVIAHIVKLSSVYPDLLPSLLLESASLHGPLETLLTQLGRFAMACNNPEQLIFLFHQMLENSILPEQAVVEHVVQLSCEWGCPRLALQIAQKIEDVSHNSQRLETQYLEGVEVAWDRAVQTKTYNPDEGLVLSILAVAGRWGRPRLATKALDVLPNLSIRAQEHHLVPLLEAYVNAGQVPDALQVLSSMREAGIVPTLTTAEPIVARLSDATVIDQAFYALEDMRKSGIKVDITALNAVIEASVRIRDPQRMRATHLAAADLGVEPNIETYNLLLKGCIHGGHRQLGDTVWSEMAAASISPDMATFQHMIALCLEQPVYEDAFYYLEKMKSDGMRPPYIVYQNLLKRCIADDDRRWKLVVDELESLGYKVDGVTYGAINGASDLNQIKTSSRERHSL